MAGLPISEFRDIIMDLAERYPTAEVDFVYPKRYREKWTTQLGHMTQFNLLRSVGNPILRIVLDHACGLDADG